MSYFWSKERWVFPAELPVTGPMVLFKVSAKLTMV